MGMGFGNLKLTFRDKNDWVLGKILEYQAENTPNNPFLQYMESKPHTYGEVNEVVNRTAHGFNNIGLKFSDKILIMLPNSLEYLYAWFGANKIGAIEVPINNFLKGYFFEHVANNSQAKFMILNEEYADVVKQSKHNLEYLETLVYVGDDEGVVESLKSLGKFKVVRWDEVIASDKSNPRVDVNYRNLGALMYTSGTTGPSKGVMMPHGQLYLFSDSNANLMRLGSSDVYYTALPFFHSNAQLLTVYPAMISGAKVVIYPRFSATEWVDHMIKHEVTVTNLLGVMTEFVYKQPPREEDSKLNLKAIMSVPTPTGIADQFKTRFNVTRLLQGFGLTETGFVTFMPYEEYKVGSCGKALDEWYELKLVDPETDEEVPIGTIGEAVVRQKIPWTLNLGYYGMPDKTLEAYRNLWFHTGDALKKDEEGYYYFVDRIKDAMRRRGENISSYEVEKIVNDNPAVFESAAIAVKSEIGGEDEVKICIVLKNGEKLDYEELIRWCDDRMPYFAVPRYVEFLKELPKTPSHKVQKIKLRELACNNATTWDRVRAGVRLKEEVKREKMKNNKKTKAKI
jgi:crotonobetaine/carnitine-CoA ligase